MNDDSEWVGKVDISLREAIARSLSSWTITYTVGKYGMDDGGSVLILQREVSDMQIPQFSSPNEPGYVTVRTTGNAKLRVTFSDELLVRPWRGGLLVRIREGVLKEGDKIIITFGDRRAGCPGFRVQTFRERRHVFRVLVDPFGTGRYVEVKPAPVMRIIGGPAKRLEVVAPSIVRVGECFSIIIRALDQWGNP